ncbi:MAG: uracil-DNA glycosylase [Alphaproteobacteria bacterium]
MTAPAEPGRDCPLCPRLAALRGRQRALHADWHNAPVASFGPLDAPLLVIGLAPGLRGANRTGRPFTGDGSGELLFAALAAHGLGDGSYAGTAADGYTPTGFRITNAVRCLPPDNRPLPAEIAACRTFLAAEIAAMPHLAGIMALGRLAHDAALAALGRKRARHPFAHGRVHEPPDGPWLADSYHPSRYNMSTGRLTRAMLDAAVAAVARRLPLSR